MKKLIIFDFDGTLADSIYLSLDIYNEIAPKYNLPKVRKSKRLRDIGLREGLKKFRIPLFKFVLLLKEHQRILNQRIDNVRIFPNLKMVLTKLKKQYKLGITTSNEKKNVLEFLKNNNIRDVFDFIECGSPIFGKDRILRKMMKDTGYRKEDVIYVGDEVRDIETAKKIGIRIISIGWGMNSIRKLRKHNPDYLIHKPYDLIRILT